MPDLAAVRRAMDMATVALVALLVWLAVQGSAGFWWMLWPVCILALPRAASLLRPIERPREPGGTNRLPQPNDDHRDD